MRGGRCGGACCGCCRLLKEVLLKVNLIPWNQGKFPPANLPERIESSGGFGWRLRVVVFRRFFSALSYSCGRAISVMAPEFDSWHVARSDGDSTG